MHKRSSLTTIDHWQHSPACLAVRFYPKKKSPKKEGWQTDGLKKNTKKNTCSLPKILGNDATEFFGRGLGKRVHLKLPSKNHCEMPRPRTESTTITTCPSMSAWSASCRPMLWVVNSRKSALPTKKKTITSAGGWASETSHKSGYNPCKWWPYQGLNGVITLLIGVL